MTDESPEGAYARPDDDTTEQYAADALPAADEERYDSEAVRWEITGLDRGPFDAVLHLSDEYDDSMSLPLADDELMDHLARVVDRRERHLRRSGYDEEDDDYEDDYDDERTPVIGGASRTVGWHQVNALWDQLNPTNRLALVGVIFAVMVVGVLLAIIL